MNSGVGGKYTAANVASFAAAFQQIAGQRWGGSEQFKAGDQAANSTEATTGSALNQGNEQSAGLAVKSQAKLSGQVGVGGTAQQNTTVSRDITPGSQGKPAGTNVKNTGAFNAAEQFLGLKNTTGRVGLDASTGGEINNAETRKDGSGTSQSTSDKAQAEKNFAQVRSAAMEVMASTQNSGVKAAGYQFLGELASSTDAKFGTNTRATLTDKASDGNSRTDGRHADASASLGNAVAQRAIGIYGTPEAAFAAFNNDPVAFGRAVGDPVASRAAMETLPSTAHPVSGIGGSVLSSPRGVKETSVAGNAAVMADNEGNQFAARSAAAGYQNQADHKGQVPKEMPSLEQANTAYTGVSGEVISGKAASLAQQRTQRGVTMAAQAINADEQGMSRLMKSALGGGAFEFFGLNNGGKETQAQLNRLAENSPEVRASLDQLAAQGGAPTADNMNKLNAALSTYQNKLSEQYGQYWRAAIQNAGEDLFGGKP
ncbi:MAG: hypothetical protein IPJ48_16805 [Propionivibrio sp.]|uniref:Uncharacterized protein n=1 Tax=Candidatus Propionivibrio dominans TaxID=2954373 RepID=A0A9D7FGA3_9RHOO|nr:hypothetical protein [Candidatus Propionivibrio dominans]